ncbi:hypothetical protein [Cupriavidus pinatubonensis]|uniref:Transmembrane protein n=1 Tax=Cupriavidus pinatubonensis TaxID=248026 RepID=A0ABM8WE89_9BURK|nr:hypothetical protein [Cupriavidus pinatubonensis]CAG9165556.1 hypothetical protein LMG23994_00738 [Cupriavidus pinatubonensis]
MDIREIQRLHEQFAHSPLTIEAPIGIQHSGNRMLPPPVYAAARASRHWGSYNRNVLLVGGIVAGILVAGAIGMSLANWQHRRVADADVPGDAAPATAPVTQAPDPAQLHAPVQTIMNPAATLPAASAPRSEMTQPSELSPKPAPPQPVAQSPMPVAPATRPLSGEALARNPTPGLRKAEPAPAQTKPAAPPATRAQHGNAVTDIKLF